MLETLKTLCSLPGASGREDAVREYDALVEKYGAERLLGRAAENSFGSDINKLFEAVQKQIEDLTTEE